MHSAGVAGWTEEPAGHQEQGARSARAAPSPRGHVRGVSQHAGLLPPRLRHRPHRAAASPTHGQGGQTGE